MDDARHARLSALFLEVCELGEEERRVVLDRECAGDEAMRHDVEELLARDEGDAAVDALPGDDVWGRVGAAWVEPASELPTRIGDYEVLGVLGSGGMGVVYRARQASPEREVAVKVMRTGLELPDLVRRFEAEAQLLARLQHPGIAQIVEAGFAPSHHGGQLPFFAMELVDGVPITVHAEREQLDPRVRLSLLARVCDSVSHAHERGVVHRDLKPSNILVDASGWPKILDFGVARALDDARGETLLTRTGQLVGTLDFMSPEQVQGQVDQRSDVYALGVLAYELMCGHLPLALASASIPEAARRIVEDDPLPLGHRDRALRGDVETIVATAMQKEPDRRYPTAAALADDIRRFLNTEPIAARPVSTIYQLTRLAQRHRGIFTGITIALLALTLGLAASIMKAREAQASLTEAQASLRESDATAAFLANLLTSVRPSNSGPDVLVRDVLKRASARIEADMGTEARIEATLQATIGKAWYALDDIDRAADHLRRGEQLLTELHGPDDRRVIRCRRDRTLVLLAQSEFVQARDLAHEIVTQCIAAHGADDPLTLESRVFLGTVMAHHGDVIEAERTLRESLAARDRLGMGGDTFQHEGLRELGDLLVDNGRPDEGLAFLEQALEHMKQHDPGSGAELLVEARIASAEFALRHLEQAEERCRRILDDTIERFGARHSTSLHLRETLAAIRLERGDFEGLEPELQDLFKTNLEERGLRHAETLYSLRGLYFFYHRTGQPETAFEMAELLTSEFRALLGSDHPDTLQAIADLAGISTEVGRLHSAELLFRELQESVHLLPPDDRVHVDIAMGLTNLLRVSDRFDEAEEVLVPFLDTLRTGSGENTAQWLFAQRQLAGIRAGQGDLEDAARLFEQVMAGLQEHVPPDSPHLLHTTDSLCEVLIRAGRPEDALELLDAAIDRATDAVGPQNLITRKLQARANHARSLVDSETP